MPHLSPMSWTLTLPLMWFSLIFLMASYFYTPTAQFTGPNLGQLSKLNFPWHW